MKKHIRLLSLVLSMVLLLCSAAPVFADYIGDPEDTAPSAQTLSANGNNGYSITANLLVFNPLADVRSTYTSVHHSGLYSNCLEFTAYEGMYRWDAEGDFDANPRTVLWNLADQCDLVPSISNSDDYICIEIPMESPKADYTLNYGCWHYSVIGTYPKNGGYSITGISRVPYAYGIYTFVEY